MVRTETHHHVHGRLDECLPRRWICSVMLALTVEEHACKTKRVGWDMVLEELDIMTMLVHGEEESESFDKHVLFD